MSVQIYRYKRRKGMSVCLRISHRCEYWSEASCEQSRFQQSPYDEEVLYCKPGSTGREVFYCRLGPTSSWQLRALAAMPQLHGVNQAKGVCCSFIFFPTGVFVYLLLASLPPLTEVLSSKGISPALMFPFLSNTHSFLHWQSPWTRSTELCSYLSL